MKETYRSNICEHQQQEPEHLVILVNQATNLAQLTAQRVSQACQVGLLLIKGLQDPLNNTFRHP